MVTLKIGRRLTVECESIKAAQQAFNRARDESFEGASTFPDGKIIDGKRKLRVSYNGRVWDGAVAIEV